MIYLKAFLFCGFICMLGQIILDNSKLTTGHITTIFSIIGAILSFLGIYPKLIKSCGAGATVLIMNFGNALYQSAMEGYMDGGFIGIFTDILEKSSLVITSTIIFSLFFTIFFKAKD